MEHRNDNIEIIGASENNLKHIVMTIPKVKLIVIAGEQQQLRTAEVAHLPAAVKAPADASPRRP